MFGLDYLQKSVGETTFFERLPLIMQAWRRGEPSVGTVDGNRLPLLSNRSSINPVTWSLLNWLSMLQTWRGPRYETGTLVHGLLSSRDAPWHLLIRKPEKQHDAEFISESLSTRLLEHINITLHKAFVGDESMRRVQLDHSGFDMTGSFPFYHTRGRGTPSTTRSNRERR